MNPYNVSDSFTNLTKFSYEDALSPDMVTFQNCVDYTHSLRQESVISYVVILVLLLYILFKIKRKKKREGRTPI